MADFRSGCIDPSVYQTSSYKTIRLIGNKKFGENHPLRVQTAGNLDLWQEEDMRFRTIVPNLEVFVSALVMNTSLCSKHELGLGLISSQGPRSMQELTGLDDSQYLIRSFLQ